MGISISTSRPVTGKLRTAGAETMTEDMINANINFPELIIEKILICLPLKRRSMFKCVSKTWYNIISDINYNMPASGLVIFSYQNQSNSTTARITTLLDVDEDGKSGKALRSFDIPFEIPMLIGSQNGLLLLRNTISSDDTRFIFCNPAIVDEKNRYMALPPMDKPLEPWHEAGFLLDKLTPDKFKVVCFKLNAQSINSGKLKTYLYTSESGKWTDHETILNKPSQLGFEVRKVHTFYRKANQISLCYKRKMHWLYKNFFVLVYDFDKQLFELINLPSKRFKKCHSRGLLYEFEGVLYYCQSTRKRLVVWAYRLHNDISHGGGGEDYYWQRKQSVLYKEESVVSSKRSRSVGSSLNILCPIAFNENLQALYLHRRQAIYSYSFKTRSLEMVWSFPCSGNEETCFPYCV